MEKRNIEKNLITVIWHRKVTETRLYQETQHTTQQNKVMEVKKMKKQMFKRQI